MKQTRPLAIALTLTGALCLSAFTIPTAMAKTTDGQAGSLSMDDELEARMGVLETEIKELKLTNKKQEALLTQTIKYLENQAASGAKLAQAMTKSESMGFTKGINYQSREVLLAALSEHCKALQKDVPRMPAAATPAPVVKRR